ncbi:probable BOI-related E3 ubiquitin-protein ligase 3 [Rhodamnia argentea]|uniref:Probable BOI-related E3 ubiquitin-protein ligase 3 n=1 Tax=Rhodamnia argentea TaxID=178133 RepID=A0A8B8NM98_9MYRT|nr:probable BOI-related E3 ubiquitin-protein ligase 3 [Rhodamnia argentea]
MAIQAQLCQENLGFPLFGSQDIVESQNGCGGFSPFGLGIQQRAQLHRRQLQEQEQLYMQQLHGACFHSVPTSGNSLEKSLIERKMAHPQGIADLIDRQSQEIQQFLRSQNERLTLVLQEQRRLQMLALVKRLESRAQALLFQKDQEMARASQKTAELEELLKKLEFESQAWQRIAQENEAMVASLKMALEQQLRERASCGSNDGDGAEDAESYCCGANRDGAGTEEEVQEQENRATTTSGVGGGWRKATTTACKACNSRASCVLFLPCRHLCSCNACEGFLDRCPLCATAKEGTVEALF